MTDTIKKLQEVREVLQWVAGFCDGYVIAPKEGDKLVVERCDKALATLDAVIAGMQKSVNPPDIYPPVGEGRIWNGKEWLEIAPTHLSMVVCDLVNEINKLNAAIAEKRLLGEG